MTGVTQYTHDDFATNNSFKTLVQSEIISHQTNTFGSAFKKKQNSPLERFSALSGGGIGDKSDFKVEMFPNALHSKKGT